MSLHPEERSETTLYRYGRWVTKPNGGKWLWLFPSSYTSREDAIKARDETIDEFQGCVRKYYKDIRYDIYREETVRTLTKEEE